MQYKKSVLIDIWLSSFHMENQQSMLTEEFGHMEYLGLSPEELNEAFNEIDQDCDFIKAVAKEKDRQMRRVVTQEFKVFLAMIPETTESGTPSGVWIPDFLKYLAMAKASSNQRPISENTIRKYHKPAVDYCNWKYGDQGFEYTKEDKQLLNYTLAKLLAEGKYLYKCKMEAVRYYFPDHVSYVLDKAYRHASQQSIEMRKLWFHRILSLLLYTATAARDTDIAVAPAYIGKTPAGVAGDNAYCLEWGHIHIIVDKNDSDPTIESCQCMIELKYCEGEKEKQYSNVKKYFDPILSYPNLCTISTLLIHAIENDLVEGNSITDVVRKANDHPHHKVVWKYPHRPVLCAEEVDGSLSLNTPATLFHVNNMLDSMTNLARVPRFAVCNLRRGCEGANTDRELEERYFKMEAVRQHLNLSRNTQTAQIRKNHDLYPQVDLHRVAINSLEQNLTPPFYVPWESARGSRLYYRPPNTLNSRKRQLRPQSSALTQRTDSSLNSPPVKSRKTMSSSTSQSTTESDS